MFMVGKTQTIISFGNKFSVYHTYQDFLLSYSSVSQCYIRDLQVNFNEMFYSFLTMYIKFPRRITITLIC